MCSFRGVVSRAVLRLFRAKTKGEEEEGFEEEPKRKKERGRGETARGNMLRLFRVLPLLTLIATGQCLSVKFVLP